MFTFLVTRGEIDPDIKQDELVERWRAWADQTKHPASFFVKWQDTIFPR